MRRQGGNFEVNIDAPTLGLVTRVPGDQPDVRAASAASNVRFEDGVACKGPGYGRLTTDPVLDSQPTLIFQAELSTTSSPRSERPAIIVTAQKLYVLLRFPTDYVP